VQAAAVAGEDGLFQLGTPEADPLAPIRLPTIQFQVLGETPVGVSGGT